MKTSLVAVLVLVASSALAQDALSFVREASELNDATDSKCQDKLEARLDEAADALKANDDAKTAVKRALKYADEHCPSKVAKQVKRKLTRALDALDAAGGQAAPVVAAAAVAKPTVTFGLGTVYPRADDQGTPSVALVAQNVDATNLKGQSVHFSLSVRRAGGTWSAWNHQTPVVVDVEPAHWESMTLYSSHAAAGISEDTRGAYEVLIAMFVNNVEAGRATWNFELQSTRPRAGEPMADADFDALIQAVNGQGFGAQRVSVVQTAAQTSYFTVAQVARLCDQVSFANERVQIVDATRRHITDRQNAYQLYGEFPFASDQEKVKRLLAH